MTSSQEPSVGKLALNGEMVDTCNVRSVIWRFEEMWFERSDFRFFF
jgi:hypothetical protein